jgi:hypothetical protein
MIPRPWLVLLPLLLGWLAGPASSDNALREDLKETVTRLASVESRVTGYPGCAQAADYLVKALHRAGVEEILTQSFGIPIPIDRGFTLTAAGTRVVLHGVWPNLVRTSSLAPAGLTGPLVYGGRDPLSELEGRDLNGRIVLLDYDTGAAWLDLFRLGARAVVFLETGSSHRKEASQKFLSVPADMPRFYAASADTAQLLALARAGLQATLTGQMPWDLSQGTNIIGVIRGSDPQLRGEAVFVTAYYDAISPAPALSPGAGQAASAAALLALAQVLTARPPARTAVLVLASGHFQGMAGMRHFMPLVQHAHGTRPDLVPVPEDAALVSILQDLQMRMLVGLDLSSGSDILSVAKPVTPYRTPSLTPPITVRLMKLVEAFEDSVLGGRQMVANGLRQDLTRMGLGSLPHVLPLDAAVASLAGCPAIAFQTINDSRPLFDSPLDTPEHVDFGRLERQVRLVNAVLPSLLGDPDLEEWEWGNDVFGTLRGEVMHFGQRSYLPDRPTAGALVRVRLRHPTLAGVRPDFWAVADDSGRFVIPGVETRIIYTRPVRIEAYALDATTGALTAAPDWGMNGERSLPGRALTVQMDSHEEEVQVVTAAAQALTITDIFDPRNLLTPERMDFINAATEAEPPVYGACLPLTAPEMELFGYKNRVGSWIEPVAVALVPPGTRVKLVMSTGLFGLGRRLLLLNSTAEEPQGVGFSPEDSEVLTHSAYQVAHDLQTLNSQRIADLERHGVRNSRLSSFRAKSAALLEQAESARIEHRHRDLLTWSREAWAYAISAYRDVERTQSGVVKGALFLLAALIPFAHFAERLLFCFADVRRQVLAYFGLFLLGFLALSQLHPAFELSISPVVILLGFVILALGMLVTSIGVSRLNRELQQMTQGHRRSADMARSGAMMTSVAVGLAHLRRRPLRTGLTCVTLILLTFAVLSFTSIQSALRANWIDLDEEAPYTGALVRMRGWKTMETTAYDYLRARFGEERTAPRAWVAVASLASSFRVERDDDTGRAAGVLGISGLTAAESEFVAPDAGLVAGRWLRAGEDDGCLLPVGVADSLGIGTADVGNVSVRVFGEVFRVIGLLERDALDREDLNGEPLTPLDAEAQKPTEAQVGSNQGGQLAAFSHLPGSLTMVLPYTAVMRWEMGTLASVAVSPRTGEERQALEALSETLDLNLFVGLGGRRFLVNTVGVSSVSGLGALAVPVGIAALIVLNTMLGSVYERIREIGTFNAVGLAPSHVSGLFMAEAVAFAVIGAVSGYLVGQAAAQLMGHFGVLQGLQLNYSSMGAVMTLGLVIGLVVMSAIYPARMAGKICTPGIERRWRPPAPDGHRLQMKLPFTLVRLDAMGMTAFQAEFWDGHREQSIGAGFYVESLRVSRDGDRLLVDARTWLAPFDQGVVQEVQLVLAPGEQPRYYEIDVTLDLLAGDLDTWGRVSRTFLDDLRKQFLMWRALAPEDREVYIAQLDSWISAAPTVEA